MSLEPVEPDMHGRDIPQKDIPENDINVQHFEFTATDGINLRGEIFGDRLRDALPVLCLPGLTRNAKDFHPLAERLVRDPDNPRLVMILNSRGRGTSDYDKNPENYDILTEANDALHALAAAGLEEAIFIGTSRGGLLTMAIAALRPGVIAGAVLNDIGPEINAQGLARIKTYLGKAKPVTNWDEAIDYIKDANFGMFPALSEEQWKAFAHMTFKEEDGKPARDFDIAIVKSLETVDLSQPLPNAWPQFMAMSHAPVLVLRGEHSDILTRETAQAMTEQHPDCQWIEVEGQGHAPMFLIDSLNDQIAAILAEMDQKHAQHEGQK
ncbi:MAG: alpha/beta hydrolase [Cohaesibacter sp.]|nr:alpha/beta hydrolase [Cohaesibacter sp.]